MTTIKKPKWDLQETMNVAGFYDKSLSKSSHIALG